MAWPETAFKESIYRGAPARECTHTHSLNAEVLLKRKSPSLIAIISMSPTRNKRANATAQCHASKEAANKMA